MLSTVKEPLQVIKGPDPDLESVNPDPKCNDRKDDFISKTWGWFNLFFHFLGKQLEKG